MLTQTLDEASSIERTELEALSATREGTCVSIYLPTHQRGKEVRQDPIRLKNRLSDAEEQLAERGVAEGDVTRLLEPLRELCDFYSDENQAFWSHQGTGLAVLLTEEGTQIFRLRVDTPELTRVGPRFYLRPLLAAAQREGEYALVAASRGELRFFEGDLSGVREVDLDDAPDSLRAVSEKAHHKGFNLHSFRTGRSGGETAVPHGHVDTDEDEPLRRYFGEIVDAIEEAEEGSGRPVVFVGVPELFAYFREAAEGRRFEFIDEQVEGAPDHLAPDALHEKAWPLVEKRACQQLNETVEKWRNADHTDLAGSDLEEVLVAAHDGRVETLIVSCDAHTPGQFDGETRRVTPAEGSTEAIDLVELAAVKTLSSGGDVRVVSADNVELPESGVAAVYRYANG